MIPNEFKGRQIIKPIIMEEFSNIGTNSIVLPGSILRKGVLLSAGSLLMGDTEEWGVYKGNPAVLIKKIDGIKIEECAKKIKEININQITNLVTNESFNDDVVTVSFFESEHKKILENFCKN
jgi:tetrahydrodipicolinate N-succinyltransferase